MGINAKIQKLEQKINELENKISELQQNEAKAKEYSRVSNLQSRAHSSPIDASAGGFSVMGGQMVWNDIELSCPPINSLPTDDGGNTYPRRAYNRHSHTRFNGGALDVSSLELVEYDVPLKEEYVDSESPIHSNLIEWDSDSYNKHCPAYWHNSSPNFSQWTPDVKTTTNSDGETIKKIGTLDISFNPDTRKWETGSSEIDVASTRFVRKYNGVIVEDENENDMSAVLYNSDDTKTNVIWDKENKVWRFLAVYADE